MSGNVETRIHEQLGSSPTNNDRMFYYPQAYINGEWKSINAVRKDRKEITGTEIVDGMVGWANRTEAEIIIGYFKLSSNG